MSLLTPAYKIEEDGSIWIESRWHGDAGRENECTGWDKVGEAAYCVAEDCHHIATHSVDTFSVETDGLIQSVAVCKRDASKLVFGHSERVYAQSRELYVPGLMTEAV